MTLFFLLNGLGIVFLLYVLVNFWKDGHRAKNNARHREEEWPREGRAEAIVATHPTPCFHRNGPSVIPFRTPAGQLGRKPAQTTAQTGTTEQVGRRISTR
jgi:hypothetical protein